MKGDRVERYQSTPRHATQSQSYHMTSSKRKWHHGFNLQLWELGPMTGVGGVAIAEKGHLTLWLAMSGCQVGGGAKEGKKHWDFLFLRSESKKFVPHSHLFCPTNQAMLLWLLPWKRKGKEKKKQEKEKEKNKPKTEITEHSMKRKGLFLCLGSVVKYAQADNMCRLKGWIDVFIFRKDNPLRRKCIFQKLVLSTVIGFALHCLLWGWPYSECFSFFSPFLLH